MLKTVFFTREKGISLKKNKTRNRFCEKLISGAVSAMMVLSMVPAGMTFAADANYADTTYTISGNGALEAASVEAQKANATTVQFAAENSVSSIGNNAFQDFTALTTVDFTNATALQTIGQSAFQGCNHLATVTFGNSSQLATIGQSAFQGCTALTSINIPDSVTNISQQAFQGCNHLATVTFGNSSQLATIDQNAFNGCTALTSITIPSNVTNINGNAFNGCTNLNTVTFDPSITPNHITINATAFANCTNIKAVYDYPGGRAAAVGSGGRGQIFPNIDNITFYSTYSASQNIANNSAVSGTWTGTVQEGSSLAVAEVDENSYSENITNMINNYDSATVLDISLASGDTRTEIPEGKTVTITLTFNDTLPNTVQKIFHETADGLTEVNIGNKTNTTITFTTDSLSNFVFVGAERTNPDNQNNSSNGSSNNSSNGSSNNSSNGSSNNSSNSSSDNSSNSTSSPSGSTSNASTSKSLRTGDNSFAFVGSLLLIMLSTIGCWLFITKKVKD